MTPSIDTIGWQAALFAERLNRLELMRLGARVDDDSPTLLVLRNHAFETVASALPAFLCFAGIPMRPVYSAYDDSLPLPAQPAAAVIVWMDFVRYDRLDDDALIGWIVSRLRQVRDSAEGPVIVANSPDDGPRAEALNAALAAWAESAPDAAVLRLDEIRREMGEGFFDLTRAEVTGTRLSDQAAQQTARKLSFELAAAALAAPLKAIAVDLDNTLFAGVLGEDGADGVVLTAGHAQLQRELAAWAARGVLIAVISRNVLEDVTELFARRRDFPLQATAVASWQVGWRDKAQSVDRVAAEFNLSPDSILFVDDNAGELIDVGRAHPGVRLLFAGLSPELTARAVRSYPGLPAHGVIFAGRASDVRANRERSALAASAADEAEYLRALQPVLTFELDPARARPRLAELSRKTNQFNMALRRLDEAAVQAYLDDADKAVVHVSLADRLADSGSVAAIFVRRDGDSAILDEVCISCRALGRKLEDVIVGEAARRSVEVLGARRIAFAYERGPRNQPALDWLRSKSGREFPDDSGHVELEFKSLVAPTPAADALRLTWTG